MKVLLQDYITENPEWVTFYPKFNHGFYLDKAGYFDERPEVHTSVTQLAVLAALPFLLTQSLWFLVLIPLLLFGWGSLYIHLPVRTGIQDCESAAWGLNYHDKKLWIYIGGAGNFEGGTKWKTITMPWAMTWYRTSLLLKDGTWAHETKGNRREFYNEEWKNPDKVFVEKYKYTDKQSNTTATATIRVKEYERRPYWFQWTSLLSKVTKSIDIEFDDEIGSEKGSWKGGVLGCGYNMLVNETPKQCLRRMEKERKF